MNKLTGLYACKDCKIWSVLDQAMISVSNFTIGIILARVLGVEAFGVYVIGLTLLLYANTFQQALVVSNMMSKIPSEATESQKEILIKGYYGFGVLIAFLASLIIYLIALIFEVTTTSLSLGDLKLPVALATFAFLLQDWGRRYLYAISEFKAVFFIDLLAYGGYVIALLILANAFDSLSSYSAFMSYFVIYLITAFLIIFAFKLRINFHATKYVITKFWRNSRDFLITWQFQWLGSSGVVLVGVSILGAHVAAGIKAVQNLLGPIHVVFQWMDNVIIVKANLILKESGEDAVANYLKQITLIGLLALSIFIFVLSLIDDWLIVFVYGEDYGIYADLLILQAIYFLITFIYRVLSYYFRVFDNTIALAKSSYWWALAAFFSTIALVDSFEEKGIMFALIAGAVMGSIYLIWQNKKMHRSLF